MDIKTLEHLQRGEANYHRHRKRREHIEELKTFDSRELLRWDGKNLAAWQSQYEPDEAQYILAVQEWKRRDGISTRRIAIAAIIISGLSLLIAALAYFHSLNDGATSISAKPIAQPAKTPQLPVQPPQ